MNIFPYFSSIRLLDYNNYLRKSKVKNQNRFAFYQPGQKIKRTSLNNFL